MGESDEIRESSGRPANEGPASGSLPWWSLVTVAIGWLTGVSAWRWWYDRGRLVRVGDLKTSLQAEERTDVLTWGGYSLALLLVFYFVVFLVRRRATPSRQTMRSNRGDSHGTPVYTRAT